MFSISSFPLCLHKLNLAAPGAPAATPQYKLSAWSISLLSHFFLFSSSFNENLILKKMVLFQ
jgi:hypothetical protein